VRHADVSVSDFRQQGRTAHSYRVEVEKVKEIPSACITGGESRRSSVSAQETLRKKSAALAITA
jgi:hypothetical protein